MKRKEFIRKFVAGGSILFAVPTFLDSCAVGDDEIFVGDKVIDLSRPEFAELGTIGGFAYKDDIIIIRTAENQYTALSKICTHQGCTVAYDPDTGNLPCPCHGSVYNISGDVIAGPAPASLKSFSVRLVDGTMIIS